MSKEQKPEWFGYLKVTEEAGLPSLMYDTKKLPCGYAFFRTRAKCDKFLDAARKSMKGVDALRLGIDIPLKKFHEWAIQSLISMLKMGGKEVMPQEVGPLAFMAMPVWIDPTKQFIMQQKASYENLTHFISTWFARQQIEDTIEGAELVCSELIRSHQEDPDTFTLWTFHKKTQDDKGQPTVDAYFGVMAKGEHITWMKDDGLDGFDWLKIGESAHLTYMYQKASEVTKEACAWYDKVIKKVEEKTRRNIVLPGDESFRTPPSNPAASRG